MCLHMMKCPYTKDLFDQADAAVEPNIQAKLIEDIRERICGQPTERTVCCDRGNFRYGNKSIGYNFRYLIFDIFEM